MANRRLKQNLLERLGTLEAKVIHVHETAELGRNVEIRPEVRQADLTPDESDVFDAAWMTGSSPDASEAIAARDVVDKILSSLSPEDRSLILMVDLEGRSLQEISDTTGWSISKIKMRLFRIRPQLRQMIQKLEERK